MWKKFDVYESDILKGKDLDIEDKEENEEERKRKSVEIEDGFERIGIELVKIVKLEIVIEIIEGNSEDGIEIVLESNKSEEEIVGEEGGIDDKS